MRKSDSQLPFTNKPALRFSLAWVRPLPGGSAGSLLFRAFPQSLDMSPCPRKVRGAKAYGHTVLPADPDKVIGTFNDNDFGVYPHTSVFFLTTLRTHRYRYARKTRLPSPCLWVDGSASCQLGNTQLSGRTPG
jgi:hypothetical protein